MNVNLKMFCILCLCIILCDTNKALENRTFFFNKVSFCRVFFCLGAMKNKASVEQISLYLFQNFDVPEEISVTFHPEIDLNDVAVRDGSIILRFERPTSRKSAKSNRKTRSFQISQS